MGVPRGAREANRRCALANFKRARPVCRCSACRDERMQIKKAHIEDEETSLHRMARRPEEARTTASGVRRALARRAEGRKGESA